MSAILDRAKAHYAAIPRKEIKVPEWGESPDRPAVITWSALSVRDQERIYAPVDGKAPAGGLVRLRAVMIKACDDKGVPLFDDMDEHALRYEVEGDIVGRIANAILYDAGIVTAEGTTIAADDQVEEAKNA
jgi:hypothetical protein